MRDNFSRALFKIRDRAAFTLAEALVAVLIMLMVSGVVTAGIPAARNAYANIVDVANSEVVLSTTISMLRNELALASDIDTPDSTTITYLNPDTSSYSSIYLGDADKIYIRKYTAVNLDIVDSSNETVNGDTALFVSEAITDKNLYVTYTGVSCTNGVVRFEGLAVKRVSDDTVAAPKSNSGLTVEFRVIQGD